MSPSDLARVLRAAADEVSLALTISVGLLCRNAKTSASCAGVISFSSPSGMNDLPLPASSSISTRSTTSRVPSAFASVTCVAVSSTIIPEKTRPSFVASV